MKQAELLQKWKGNKLYTLKLIEAMPEDNWGFRPADGVKTFQSQCAHLTTWLRTHSRFVTGIKMPKPAVKTRPDIVCYLTDFFDSLLTYLKHADEESINEVVAVFYGKR